MNAFTYLIWTSARNRFVTALRRVRSPRYAAALIVGGLYIWSFLLRPNNGTASLSSLLGQPTESPYGNPIPGLDELGADSLGEDFMTGVEPLSQVAKPETSEVLVRRISEEMQKDEDLMSALRRVGARPDKTISVVATADGVLLGSGGETAEIVPEAAEHIFVKRL